MKKIENITAEKVKIELISDTPKWNTRLLIDGWLYLEVDYDACDQGIISTLRQIDDIVVESYSYFWMDYITHIAKAANLELSSLEMNLFAAGIENKLSLNFDI